MAKSTDIASDKVGLHYRVAGRLAAAYIRFVFATSRVVSEPEDFAAKIGRLHPGVLAMWHGQFMLVPNINPNRLPVRIFVAKHADAEVLGQALTHFGMELIRGAGSGTRQRDRGGMQAFRYAVKSGEDGWTVALTGDIPPGPARKAGIGIVMIARQTGLSIVPAAMATSRYIALDTWSRFTINLPFSKLGIVVGDPIKVPKDADSAEVERLRLEVENQLNAVTLRAYALAGSDPMGATPRLAWPPGTAPIEKPGLLLKAYRLGTRALTPIAPIILRHRLKRHKEDPDRLAERQGVAGLPRPAGPLVWLHAASVGEVNAILPVITALAAARPDLKLLLTSGTVTSASLAAERLGTSAIHQYVPLDTPRYVARFLDHWSPDLAVFTESEIWPNLILSAAERKIPAVLVNARMSKRSFRKWRRFGSVSAPLFSRFDRILAQNEKLARRFIEVGARRADGVGNLKADAPPLPVDEVELRRLSRAMEGRAVLLAASTHEGEEAIVAEAHRRLAVTQPGFHTIIVPRHPERGAAIAAQLAGTGLRVARRALGELPTPETDIYVADTLGELGTFYSLTRIAFVGGSLVAHGGQNPIEPVRLGCFALTGPSRHNFDDIYDTLIQHGVAAEVTSADDIVEAVRSRADDPAAAAAFEQKSRAALASLTGALERTVAALLDYIPTDAGLKRAS
ncbi:MAG: glycosyltransferase N-terminal domain-containing protein [Hyphomicrobiaceae bacterium]